MIATILYLHSSSDLYGSDRSLLRTVQGLSPGTYRAVVCLPYQGPLVGELRKAGATVLVWNLGVMRRNLFTPWGMAQFLVTVLRSVIKLRRIVAEYRVDLIHSNTSAVIAGGLVARSLGIPHFWHVREIILTPSFVRRFIAWNVMRGATKVLCVSASVRDNLVRDQSVLETKAVVLHNGIDVGSFAGGNRETLRQNWGILPGELLVGMLGRVGIWKGEEEFLEAARRTVKDARLPLRFVAVGSAFKDQEWKFKRFQDAVRSAGLGDRYLVKPFRTDVPDVLAALDIFVLPSVLPDPFPTIVLEAMAAGKAIIAYAHGGVMDMLEDGHTGYLVKPNDVDALADRIKEVALNPALRSACGIAAHGTVVGRFSLARYTTEMLRLYATALGEQVR